MPTAKVSTYYLIVADLDYPSIHLRLSDVKWLSDEEDEQKAPPQPLTKAGLFFNMPPSTPTEEIGCARSSQSPDVLYVSMYRSKFDSVANMLGHDREIDIDWRENLSNDPAAREAFTIQTSGIIPYRALHHRTSAQVVPTASDTADGSAAQDDAATVLAGVLADRLLSEWVATASVTKRAKSDDELRRLGSVLRSALGGGSRAGDLD